MRMRARDQERRQASKETEGADYEFTVAMSRERGGKQSLKMEDYSIGKTDSFRL